LATSRPVERADFAHPKKSAERLFYTAYLVSLTIVIFVGFAPSFYLRGVVEPYWPLRPLGPWALVHAIVTSVWVLLFPLQALLIAIGRRSLHQRIGNWSFLLGGVMAVLAYATVARFSHEAIVLSRTVMDLFLLPILLAVAWQLRWDAQTHKRLMVAILCLLAVSAVERMPFWDDVFLLGGKVVRLSPLPLLLPLWAWDLTTNRKLHRGTIIGSVSLAIATIPRLIGPPLHVWSKWVTVLPGFGWP
jgi:hypothetical protein